MESKNKIKWNLVQHYIFDKAYVALYVHPTLKAQFELITKRKRLYPDGNSEIYIYIEGYDEEFRTEKEFMAFYNNLDEASKRRLIR